MLTGATRAGVGHSGSTWWQVGSCLCQQERQPHKPPACAVTMDPFLDAQPGALPQPLPQLPNPGDASQH